MNPDLKLEREQASFPVREMTYLLDGGEDVTQRRERMFKLAAHDPILGNDDRLSLDRVGRYKRVLQKIKRIEELRRNLSLTSQEWESLKFTVVDMLPTFLHDNVFVNTLRMQMDDEQAAKWVPLAERYEIIGAYAQTELAHGSNVQGLETTATFDRATDEFVIHSPTLTSTKFWPGCLGCTSNYCVVFARLIIDGHDYGVHWFLVQIRSRDTHLPLPGVTVGDIGPKLGSHTNDNGFVRFDHVRIPRTQMMMRYAKVARDGTYTKPENMRISYATMIDVRAWIVVNASYALQKATTIAVRYSAVRRQFGSRGQQETQVLDYRMQQHRILPLVAAAYALMFTGRFMLKTFSDLMTRLKSGDYSSLAEVHATAAGLKSLTTQIASDGIEACRKACGGHGYLVNSGLPELLGDYAQMCTVEGENYMLTQQTTRFLLKALQQVQGGGKLTGTVAYLNNAAQLLSAECSAQKMEDFLRSDIQLQAFDRRATQLIAATGMMIQQAVAQGASFADAWNDAQVEINRCSRAHTYRLIVALFIDAVATAPASLRGVLKTMSDLFALTNMENDIGAFMQGGYMSSAQADMVRAGVRQLLVQVRRDAVPLVDAFNLPDLILASTLGRYDGNVYEALYDAALKSTLNARQPVEGYEEFLRPLMRQQLSRL